MTNLNDIDFNFKFISNYFLVPRFQVYFWIDKKLLIPEKNPWNAPRQKHAQVCGVHVYMNRP